MSRCRICRTEYERKRLTQKVCGSVDCAIEHGRREAKRKLEKAGRKALREGRDRLKSKADYMREAQVVFNKFIRLRDWLNGHGCISCGTHNGKANAGHYRSVGSSPELRFEESQVALQCERCNTFLSGNLIEYRKGLLSRVGQEKLDWIEGPHDAKHYSIEELKGIKKKYNALCKELENKVL